MASRSARAQGWRAAALLLTALAASACATARPEPVAPGPREVTPDLPPIPEVDGALDLRVSYPRDSAFVATRGDNFIFGSTGTGDARVWINEREVEVQPNGGFLAFIPVPEDAVYRLRAEADGRTATLEVPVRLPDPPPGPGDSLVILPGSAYPAGGWAVLPGERIEVGFRGTAGATARLLLPNGTVVPLVERHASAGGATDFGVEPGDPADPAADARARPAHVWYRGFFAAVPMISPDTTVAWATLSGPRRPSSPVDTAPPPPPPADVRRLEPDRPGDPPLGRPLGEPVEDAADARAGELTAGAGAAAALQVAQHRQPGSHGVLELVSAHGQVVRQVLPLNLAILDPDRPRVGLANDPNPPAENGDGAIIARPGPGGGPYHYTWVNGTELTLTGERDGAYRVRVADDLDVWSPAGHIDLLPAGTPPPASRVATVRMDPQPGYVDVHVALDRRLPYEVEETEGSVKLVVFGALSRANFLQHGRVDPYIVRGEWDQPTNDRFVLTVHTATRPWGYETYWAEGDDLVLRLRRPPAIDPDRPLRGVRVGIDPGHGGADRFTMGPTGLTEADANLAISLALRDALESRGAGVVMTRTTDSTLTLVERTEIARAEDVDLWVSVHNNAFPDGVNPWENSGTSVYYNHPRAASLAWEVQEELLDELGLRDLGVGRADLHQARFTWAPSILTENMFMMIPQQEAALRQPAVVRRIAEAHVRGMAEWLRAYALGTLPAPPRDR
ncbi:MAG: N-acetylmuramoyl-L-alanine amidase [Gemmatimonadetes bacterium]|nr:N-acetylmuramoyl-L-alanine amidase [Gemmatimonadota bacterium]